MAFPLWADRAVAGLAARHCAWCWCLLLLLPRSRAAARASVSVFDHIQDLSLVRLVPAKIVFLFVF